jgi:hypothetical protein
LSFGSDTVPRSLSGGLLDLALILIALPIGFISTAVMDVAARVLALVGIAGRGERRTGPELLGRWIGYMPRGVFRHEDIRRTPPLRFELRLGLVVHYLIGWSLALAYLWGIDLSGIDPTLVNAVVYGIATTGFAWFLMFPAWGMGWFGASPPESVVEGPVPSRPGRSAGSAGRRRYSWRSRTQLARSSLWNHLIFGLGLALAMAIFDPLR